MKLKVNSTVIGIFSPVALFLVFLIFKMTGAVSWSWWWITSPLWIMAALIIITAILLCVVLYKFYGKI